MSGRSAKRMTQAYAQVTDAADGRLLMRALLSLGGRQLDIDVDWGQPPDAPHPDEWPRRSVPADAVPSFSTEADIRFGPYNAGDRNILCWARLAGTMASTRQGLSALADTLSTGMHLSLGRNWRGASLDNTVRIAGDAQSEWVLFDFQTMASTTLSATGSCGCMRPTERCWPPATSPSPSPGSDALTRLSGCSPD